LKMERKNEIIFVCYRPPHWKKATLREKRNGMNICRFSLCEYSKGYEKWSSKILYRIRIKYQMEFFVLH
jgi:hypothetical protein